MTNITELTAKLKAAALKAKAATEDYAAGRISITTCYSECAEFNSLTDGPDQILPLIEALEAAQSRIAELEARTLTVKLPLCPASLDVLSERKRQRAEEGWSSEHDDEYQNSELADAAACYAMHAHNQGMPTPAQWPWYPSWWKQSGARRDLVKAGALILAEIERIDRAAGIKLQIEGE